MHGTLRFILALMVALSHLGVLLPDFNQGVFAVVIFYLLAGMVSQKLIAHTYLNRPIAYYKNRIKRIFPLYFFALLVALTAYLLGASSYFISKAPHLSDWLANATILPLSYYYYTHQDTFTLLPPTWSLGVELQFYLLLPLLARSKNLFIPLLATSFILFTVASLGIINSDIYGYRFLGGVIFIFMLGMLIQRVRESDNTPLKTIKQLYLLLLLLFAYTLQETTHLPYNYETLSALLAGIPLLLYTNYTLPKPIDSYLGSLSYTFFLLHFPSLWLCKLYLHQSNIPLILLTTLLLSILSIKLSFLLYNNNTRKKL